MAEKTKDEVFAEISDLIDLYGEYEPDSSGDTWEELSEQEKQKWFDQLAQKRTRPRNPIGDI